MLAEQIQLLKTPVGQPQAADFALRQVVLPAPSDGEVLVEVLAVSLDPYQRIAMAGRHLTAAVRPGDVVPAEGLVKVLASKHPEYAQGQVLVAPCGWRSHAKLGLAELALARTVLASLPSPTLALGVLGMPGLSAWAGFHRLCVARPGQTLVVSAAAGPVGATVGQLARLAGCRVIGIASGARKCEWLQRVAGFDACIDRGTQDLGSELDRLCPKGVDIYFDNVGGRILEALARRLSPGGRLVLCGLAAQHCGEETASLDPVAIIRARASVHGLVVYDHVQDFPTMQQEFIHLIRQGRLHYLEDIAEGLAMAPGAFMRLMRGENLGKALVLLRNGQTTSMATEGRD